MSDEAYQAIATPAMQRLGSPAFRSADFCSLNRGEAIMTLKVERPAAGGRMIARHDGAIVFVAGAIPGEVVEAEVEKVQRGTVWAAA